MTEAPLMEVSSTMIRQAIKDKKNVSFFVPQAVWQYLDEMNFYKK
jgi:nicotinate-nucleotide adenylyltransferase